MSSSFAKAHDFTLSASEINFGTTNYYGHGGGSKAAALEKLQKHIVAGAMHDSAERCDAPKCHPETRVAVQDETIGWILDGDVEDEPKNMLWVTGPAGGGKTAIMGSIANTCHKKGLLGCGFFFSSFVGSVDRRSKRCLVATMAYQLVQHKALCDVGERILSSIERNPAVFEQQLEVQLDQLLLQPFRESRRDPDGLPWPKVIVIDGLDECDAVQYGDTARSPHVAPRTKEADQTEILHMLLKAANDPFFPFRFIIASRPEPAIQSFFTDVAGDTTRKIFLDDKYNPDADMLLFAEAKFADICRRYQLSFSWPSKDVKHTLVRNASGQFVYVSTVMRFIEGSSALPQELLDQVLKLRATDASRNPFAPLDALYAHILNSSPNPFLTACWLNLIFGERAILDGPARFIRLFLESSPGEASHVFRGLNSLVSIPPTDSDYDDYTPSYSLFHKSLTDFLEDRSRCGSLYLDAEDVWGLYSERYLQIWKDKGPATPLSAHERGNFMDRFFNMYPGFSLVTRFLSMEQNLDWYDIAWWARSQSKRAKDSNTPVENLQRIFLYVHQICNWYRRCRPVCKYIRIGTLKELRKLGWTTPGWKQLLRLNFTQSDSTSFDATGIAPPAVIHRRNRSRVVISTSRLGDSRMDAVPPWDPDIDEDVAESSAASSR